MNQLPAHIAWLLIALFLCGLWAIVLGMALGVR